MTVIEPLAGFMFSISAKLVSAMLEPWFPAFPPADNRKAFHLIGSYWCHLVTTNGLTGK